MTLQFACEVVCDSCGEEREAAREPTSDRIVARVVRTRLKGQGWGRLALDDGRRMDLCPVCLPAWRAVGKEIG